MKRLLVTIACVALGIAVLLFCVGVARDTMQRWVWGPTPAISDPPAPALTVRMLDVGQGDATYIRNGDSRVIVDGGPDPARFGKLLDSLGIRDTVIDVVILSHAHYDHYSGLRALFDSRRRIRIRYFFENKDPSTAYSLERLRDSIQARVRRDGMVYRSTDDPCNDGSAICSITMRGGAKLHIMRPPSGNLSANNRSAAVKIVGADSASFTMLLTGDAEHAELRFFERMKYAQAPGLRVDVLKAGHHGSCNAVSRRFLNITKPSWVIASLAAQNEYGHMHAQAKAVYSRAGVPWYRTDQNGTITVTAPGTPKSGYTVTPSRAGTSLNGPSDRKARSADCEGV